MSNVDLVEVFVDPTGPEIIEVMSPGPPGVQGPTGATGAGFTSIASGTILGNNSGSASLPTALNAAAVRSLLALATSSEVVFSGLSFTGTGSAGLVLKSLTTAQYNALTPANGDLFRDSTTDRIDARLARGTVELLDTAGGQTINGDLVLAGTPNSSFPQRVGNLQISEGGVVQSGNGDINGTGTPRQVHRFNSSQTDADAVGWGLSYTNAAPITSSDAVTYRDHVYVIGVNAIGSGLRMDDTKPYLALQFESKFTNSTSANFGSEWHLEHRAPGAAAPNYRAISAFLPFNLNQRGLGSLVNSFDTVLFSDQLGASRMQWNLHQNDILMLACRQYFDTNNSAPLQQRNAANSSYLALPWIDNLDRIRISQPSFSQGATTTGNSNAAHQYQALSWAANNHMVMAVIGASDAVSGSKVYSGFQTTASINGEWNNRITNTFAGGEAVWDTLVSGTGGRAKTIYRTFSQGGFDVGFDGVTDCFLISRAQGLGIDSLTYVTMTRASNVPANSVWTHRGSVRFGGSGTPVVSVLSATATLDFPSIAANSFADLTITVTGAVSGDTVVATPIAGSAITDVIYSAWVSAANTVTIRAVNNSSTTARDPASGTFRATVIRF